MTGPPAADRPGEATVHRYIDRDRDLLVARGDFGPLFAAYLDHARRWEQEPDDLSQTFMRQGLGAAVLHLAGRPKGEFVGWTIQIHRPPTNVFLTGDSAEGIVTGRIFTENVRETDHSRMYVQTSRAPGRTSRSTIEVYGLDILEMFERFYRQSEQNPARFLEVSPESLVMLLALPDADTEWLTSLPREEALAVPDGKLRSLGTTIFRFQCGCNPDRILEVVRKMFRSDPAELFRGDPGVEISCPRCGRRWWVDRERFDRADGPSTSGD